MHVSAREQSVSLYFHSLYTQKLLNVYKNTCTNKVCTGYIISSVAPIIGLAIGNTLYRQVFLYRLSDRYV